MIVINWGDFLLKIYQWVFDIFGAVGEVWNWFITPIDIFGFIQIEPIFLVGIVGIVAGIIKAIVA